MAAGAARRGTRAFRADWDANGHAAPGFRAGCGKGDASRRAHSTRITGP